MKQYLEAYQQVPENQEADWVRLEIEGDSDLDNGIIQVDAIMADSKPYRVSRHYCNHDTKGGCKAELIKNVV